MTGVKGRLLQPALHRVPGHSFDSRDGGLVDAVDAHCDDLVEDCARALQSIVGGSVCRREGLATSLATIAPPPSLAGFVKGVTDDIAQADSPMLGAIFVRAGEFIDVVLPAHTC